jgi:hypothetical protein
MVLLVEVVILRAGARKWIIKAAKVPTKLPNMANSTPWVVYENGNPATLIARREPRANASFVANSDRRRLGTTIPAMNKVNATSISSRASEKTFCLFIVSAFSFRKHFHKNPFVAAWIWLGSGKQMVIDSFKIDFRAYQGNWKWWRASFAPKQEQVYVLRIHGSTRVTVRDASSSPIRRLRKLWRMIAEDIVYPTHGRRNNFDTTVVFSRLAR